MLYKNLNRNLSKNLQILSLIHLVDHHHLLQIKQLNLKQEKDEKELPILKRLMLLP